MRRHLILLLAALALAGGAIPLLPARSASAYMLQCCSFPRDWVPNLVAAVAPGQSADSSSWFRSALATGINNWNGTPTPVNISVDFSTARSYQIQYWTAQDTPSNHGPSWAQCLNTANTSSGTVCTLAQMELFEGCFTNSSGTSFCDMTSNTPNFDIANVTHETGHTLGLAHSCTSNAIMSGPNSSCSNGGVPYSCYSESNCITDPQQDDINGVVRMYGNNSYQYSGGSGCADIKSPSAPTPTQASVPTIQPPPPPEQSYIDSATQQAQGALGNPTGTATNEVNAGLSATGKVVPWSRLPSPGSVPLPVGLGTVNRPC